MVEDPKPTGNGWKAGKLVENDRVPEANFRDYIKYAPVGVFLADESGHYRDVNPAASKMTGYSGEELLEMSIPELVHEEWRGVALQAFQEVNEKGRSYAELGINRKDGSIGFISVEAVLLSPSRILAFTSDITARKKAEEALGASECKFQALFENLAEGVALHEVVLNLDHEVVDYRLLELNPAFEMHTGIRRDSALGKLATEVYGTDAAPYLDEFSNVALNGGHHAFETYFPPLKKHFRISVVSPLQGQFATLFEDITKRREFENQLRIEKDRYQGLFEHMHSGFILMEVIFDAEGTPVDHRLLEANAEFEAQTGLKRELEIGKTSADLTFKWPSEVVKSFYHVAMGGPPINYERFNESLHRYYDVRAFSPVHGQWGMLFNDITKRKQAEEDNRNLQEQLQQAQKMESLGQLAGGVAHDMNNVLGAILALASAHLVIQPQDNSAYTAFETIRDAATRGGQMVKRLLTFARQNPIEKRELDLNALLLEEVRLLERTTLGKIHIQLDLAPDLRPIHGDGSALAHAFINLCVNAVDAMGEGGTLTLQTLNLNGHQVQVLFADNGCGMTKEVMAKAMAPFFTTKAVGKGTGLGLAMVFATVRAHGGHITLQSEVGQGTSVRIIFPATTTQDLGEAKPPGQPMSLTQELGILLVDDDDLILKSTRMLLEVQGHNVTSAASGEEALALLDQGLRPDAVILDMNMPGLGGKGTLPRLRDICPTAPVFLATGRADDEAMALVAAHSFVTMLPKPFSFEELRGHLQRVGSRVVTGEAT